MKFNDFHKILKRYSKTVVLLLPWSDFSVAWIPLATTVRFFQTLLRIIANSRKFWKLKEKNRPALYSMSASVIFRLNLADVNICPENSIFVNFGTWGCWSIQGTATVRRYKDACLHYNSLMFGLQAYCLTLRRLQWQESCHKRWWTGGIGKVNFLLHHSHTQTSAI